MEFSQETSIFVKKQATFPESTSVFCDLLHLYFDRGLLRSRQVALKFLKPRRQNDVRLEAPQPVHFLPLAEQISRIQPLLPVSSQTRLPIEIPCLAFLEKGRDEAVPGQAWPSSGPQWVLASGRGPLSCVSQGRCPSPQDSGLPSSAASQPRAWHPQVAARSRSQHLFWGVGAHTDH